MICQIIDDFDIYLRLQYCMDPRSVTASSVIWFLWKKPEYPVLWTGMNGGYRFFMHSRKLPGFREAVKPRPVGGDRSLGATFFYFHKYLMFFDNCAMVLPEKTHWTGEFHEAIYHWAFWRRVLPQSDGILLQAISKPKNIYISTAVRLILLRHIILQSCEGCDMQPSWKKKPYFSG